MDVGDARAVGTVTEATWRRARSGEGSADTIPEKTKGRQRRATKEKYIVTLKRMKRRASSCDRKTDKVRGEDVPPG
jgi:hypothetical protein